MLGWLVLPLVRQQLHALLDRFFCASDSAGGFLPFFPAKAGCGGMTADSEKGHRCSTPADPPARTRQIRKNKNDAADSDAYSASQPDQAEREAVGERAVAPASHSHWPPAADQRTQGPAKRWPVGAFSSNPLPIPGNFLW